MIDLAVILFGYLIGSIPTGLLVIRLVRGLDIRRVGSGNIGTINVYRVAGLPTALLVLAVDIVKGALPVFLARTWGRPETVIVLAGVAAIVGHNWSIFLRFAGGKGIATSFGVLLQLSPIAALVAASVWAVVAMITRYASLASLLAVATVPFVMWRRAEPAAHLSFGAVALVFAVYKHKDNIARLLRGQELRITDRPA
ncbi:MAG: glycerol-3-phosphate 1-O-acyltransferase PlsY [bacterium]